MSIRTSSMRAIFAVSFLLFGSACTSPDLSSSGDLSNPTESAQNFGDYSRRIDCSTASIDPSKYRIGAGDELAIMVRPDDLTPAVVRRDGTIFLLSIGEVYVENRTPKEVGLEVTERLANSIRDPLATVVVMGVCSDYSATIIVSGAVRKLTSLPINRENITVLEAVLAAGGIDEDQYQGGACLYRRDGNRLPIDLDSLLSRTDMTTNYALEAGDVVTVFYERFLTESLRHCLTGKDWGT